MMIYNYGGLVYGWVLYFLQILAMFNSKFFPVGYFQNYI